MHIVLAPSSCVAARCLHQHFSKHEGEPTFPNGDDGPASKYKKVFEFLTPKVSLSVLGRKPESRRCLPLNTKNCAKCNNICMN